MKITSSSRLRALPLLLAFVGAGSALSFSALTPPSPAQTSAIPASVGVVDEEKLADGYKAYQSAISALDARAQGLDAKIPAREYLDDSQGNRFDALIILPTLTPAQQIELDKLVETGSDRKAKYLGLVGKANRTDADTRQMQELLGFSNKNKPALQRLSQNLLEAIRAEQDKVDKDYTDRANQVVIRIAGEKKLVAILRKKALVWSADNIDITDEVLKSLNPKS